MTDASYWKLAKHQVSIKVKAVLTQILTHA